MNMAIETNHSQVAAKPTDCPVILHISDLHFGLAENEAEEHNNQLVLDELAKEVLGDEEWRPSFLCITGDVANTGAASEYDKAYQWLIRFLNGLSLAPSALFICPGNHDVDWGIAEEHPRPESVDEIDAILSVPLPSYIEKPFAEYTGFLNRMGVPQCCYSEDGHKQSHMFGARKTNHNVTFICCNSCFYSRNTQDKGMPLLGNNLLNYMQSERLMQRGPDHETIIIALVHHPKEQLDKSEVFSWGGRPAAFNRLAEMTHVILSGHEHANVMPWEHSGYGAYYSCIGAACYNIREENSFQLFRINWRHERYECRYFQWDPSNVRWLEIQHLRKNWPFDKAITELAGAVATKDAKPHNSKANDLVKDLWTQIQCQDFKSARDIWRRDREWFVINRPNIKRDLVEQVELCVQEIESRSE